MKMSEVENKVWQDVAKYYSGARSVLALLRKWCSERDRRFRYMNYGSIARAITSCDMLHLWKLSRGFKSYPAPPCGVGWEASILLDRSQAKKRAVGTSDFCNVFQTRYTNSFLTLLASWHIPTSQLEDKNSGITVPTSELCQCNNNNYEW